MINKDFIITLVFAKGMVTARILVRQFFFQEWKISSWSFSIILVNSQTKNYTIWILEDTMAEGYGRVRDL